MTKRAYLRLPVNPDEGFPQAFRLNVDQKAYSVLLYVNALEQVVEECLFDIDSQFATELDRCKVSAGLREQFLSRGSALTLAALVTVIQAGSNWTIVDTHCEYTVGKGDHALVVARLHVSHLENLPDDYVFRLPEPSAFMVMQVGQDTAAGTQVVFHRKVVPNLEYEAADLAFVFYTMKVVKRNLNGVGSFGSEVVGGVAPRWPL